MGDFTVFHTLERGGDLSRWAHVSLTMLSISFRGECTYSSFINLCFSIMMSSCFRKHEDVWDFLDHSTSDSESEVQNALALHSCLVVQISGTNGRTWLN